MTAADGRKLYVRDGSRYVELSPTLLVDCPPIPTPRRLDDGLPEAWRADPDNPARTVVADVALCPHGHLAPWAKRKCCGPNP